MPNLVNRRRKKSKTNESIVHVSNTQNDSTDSDYEFSSKLNYKYNVLPEKLKPFNKSSEKKEAHKIRYENLLTFFFFINLF
jgi:hypothetical protein